MFVEYFFAMYYQSDKGKETIAVKAIMAFDFILFSLYFPSAHKYPFPSLEGAIFPRDLLLHQYGNLW